MPVPTAFSWGWRYIAAFSLLSLYPGLSLASNVVTGDCAALLDHIKYPGVEDAHGVNHPTYAGWTVADFDWVTIPSKEPRVGNPKGVVLPPDCLHTWVRAEFTAKPVVSILQWKPSSTACNQCACEERAVVWQNDYDVHENAHVQQAKDLAAEWTAKWAVPRHFSYCGQLAGQAGRLALNARITSAMSEEVRLLTLEFDKRGMALDAIGATGVALPDCGAECAGCAASETPQTCKAPGQHCNLGVCAQDVCCSVTTDWGKPGQMPSFSWMPQEKCGALNENPTTVARIAPSCHCTGGCQ